MSIGKKLQIRNSTAEFLIFSRQAGEAGIEVRVAEETVWLTQKLISVLFDKGRSTITEHLKNIFETGELEQKSVCRDFRHTAKDGKEYTTQFYNLDAIIAVGFRVNSGRAIQFRQWATVVLRDFAIRGYVLDNERLKNGSFLSKEYYENLLAEILSIRKAVTDQDQLVYVNHVIKGKLLESATLQQQAANNTKEQFANSPDLKTELLNAIMGALDAHNSMSTQALNSATVQDGIKDILLNNAGLYETLRDQAGR